jgi:hypothetical protein
MLFVLGISMFYDLTEVLPYGPYLTIWGTSDLESSLAREHGKRWFN